MGAVAELKFRRGAILEQHLADGPGAVVSYREALTLGALARRRAHGAAGLSVERRSGAAAGGRPGAGADLRVDRRSGASGRGAADQAFAREEDRQARRAAAADRQAGRSARRTPTRPGRPTRAPSRRARRRAAGARVAGEPGQHPRHLAAAGRAVRKGALGQGQREAAVGAGARALAGRRGRLRREAGSQPSARSSTSAGRRASSRRTPPRWWRWSGSTPAPSAGAIWSTRCSRRRSWSPTRRSAKRSASASPPSGRRCWQRRAGDRRLERRAAGQPLATCGRCARSIASTSRAASSVSWPTTCSASWRWSSDDPAAIGGAAGPARRAARAERLNQLGAAVDTYAKILKLEPRAPRDHRGAGADPPRARSTSWMPRSCWSRSTRSAATGHGSSASTRWRPSTRPIRSSRSRFSARSPTATRSASTIRSAPTRRSAARWPRIRSTPRCRRPSSGWRARSTSWTIWSARYGQLVVGDRRPRAQERALSQDRAPLRGRSGRRPAGGGRLRRGARSLAAGSRGGQRARAALPARRRLREPGAAAPAQGGDRRSARGKEGALLPGRAALRGGPREPRSRGEGLPARPVDRRHRPARRSISSSGSTSASGAGTI